jgi:hypothetical protein
VGPFESVGLNTDVGGIQVRPMDNQLFWIMFKIRNCIWVLKISPPT